MNASSQLTAQWLKRDGLMVGLAGHVIQRVIFLLRKLVLQRAALTGFSQYCPGLACPVPSGVSCCGEGKDGVMGKFSPRRAVQWERAVELRCSFSFSKAPAFLSSCLVVQRAGQVSERLPCQSLHLRRTVLFPALTGEHSLFVGSHNPGCD